MACPIPLTQRGKYLLALVDALSMSLELNEAHVMDASEIACHGSEVETRIFITSPGFFRKVKVE